MDKKDKNIFNAVLYPYISNDYKMSQKEEEFNTSDKDNLSNSSELQESFVDSDLYNIDFINDYLLNDEKANINSVKEEKNYINEKKNKKRKKKKKINKLKNYNIKKGDWLCPKCNNLNFHFRTVCNICGINK